MSSSQEGILKHTPSWEEKRADDGGGGKGGEAVITTTFCMQELMEWASLDTTGEGKRGGDNDSYNPAFESKGSQSLSLPTDPGMCSAIFSVLESSCSCKLE